MNNLSKLLMSTWLFAVCIVANAQQPNLMVQFPMEVTENGMTVETVGKQSFPVHGVLAPVCVRGVKGEAWRLDGYSSFLKAQMDSRKLDGLSRLTFSLWVAPESYPMMKLDVDGEWFTTMVGNLAVSEDNVPVGYSKGFAFQLGSRGTYAFIGYVNGQPFLLQSPNKLPRYQWNHLVVTVDTHTRSVVMYNNGSEVASAKCLEGNFDSDSSELYVGKAYNDVKTGPFYLNTFNGLIDDFEIYAGIDKTVISERTDIKPMLAYSSDRYANDILRPSFHGMPSAGWTNETHGACYDKGKFHVFFQKNPNGPYMSRLNWGHIISDNLYKWYEVKTAVSPEEWYDKKGCWSGCVFTDSELTGDKPNLFYTSADYVKAMISQAKPKDDGLLDWEKVDKNPLLKGRPKGLDDDFRDCYLFRDGKKLYMIVGSSKKGNGTTTLHRYDAKTGMWSNDGKLFFSGTDVAQSGKFWEMPSITKLGDKWLFVTTPLETSQGVRALYWTGNIRKDGTFSPDGVAPKTIELSGYAKDGYGLLSPTFFRKDGKVLMLGIVPDKLPIEENFKLGYAHTYSLPREVSLDSQGNLMQKPYAALTAMRTNVAIEKSEFNLSGSMNLSPVQGRTLELSGTFVAGQDDFGFTFFGDGSKSARFVFSPSKGTVKLDFSDIDRIVQDDMFGGIYESLLPKPIEPGEDVKLTIYVDYSIIDVFVNDTYAASVRVFPKDKNAVLATVFCDGTAKVKSIRAYVLDANLK